MTDNTLEEKASRLIGEYRMLDHGQTVTVGISGGADSVCLLFLLSEWKEKYGISLRAVHVLHGIRGKEAREDAAFAEKICRSLCVPFRLIEVDIPALAKEKGWSLEEAGHYERDRIFREEETDRIALAHHAEDHAETVLFHLIRGSGMAGLSGIPPVNGRVIRPLLTARRAEIEDYLIRRGIGWRTDQTNSDLAFARNRLRLRVLPEAEQINEKAVEHICKAAESLAREDRYLQKIADAEYEKYIERKNGGTRALSLSAFKTCDPVILSRIIRKMLEENTGSLKDLSRLHIEQILKLSEMRSGKSFDLPGELTAVREFDHIVIRKRKNTDYPKDEENLRERIIRVEEILQSREKTVLPDGNTVTARILSLSERPLSEYTKNEAYTKCFDYDKINDTALFRTRRSGDRIGIRGGTKKLKDVLIEDRIPESGRNRIFLLSDGNRIMWIPGGRMGEEYKITETTKRVLEIRMEVSHE